MIENSMIVQRGHLMDDGRETNKNIEDVYLMMFIS